MASCRKDWRKVQSPRLEQTNYKKIPTVPIVNFETMTQLLQLQKTEVLKLNSSSCKIQTLDLWDHGRCSTLPIELTSPLGVPGGGIPRISSDRDDRTGTKIKTKKIPRASNKPPQNPWIKI